MKYISDAFEEKHAALSKDKHADPEDRDEYTADRIFWVPKSSRWAQLQAKAKQPYCRIRDLEKAGIAKHQAASEYLQSLAALGFLRPVKVGTQVLYLNEALFKILGK